MHIAKHAAIYGGMIVAPLILIGVLASKLAHNENIEISGAPNAGEVAALSNAQTATSSGAVSAVPKMKNDAAGSVGDKNPADKDVSAAGVVSVLVRPWGEIYLNGKMKGISPPMTKLRLGAGEYTVEIKNTIYPVYTQRIKIQAGEEITIQHKFGG